MNRLALLGASMVACGMVLGSCGGNPEQETAVKAKTLQRCQMFWNERDECGIAPQSSQCARQKELAPNWEESGCEGVVPKPSWAGAAAPG
jgi:hypothetical protein